MSLKEIEKLHEKITKVETKCNCGHTVFISPKIDKKICTWCGKYVFKDKKDEFMYRIKEAKGKTK